MKNKLLLLFLVWSLPAWASESDVLDEAKQYLRNDDAAGAYDLLIGHEDELSGRDTFDYLLGVAALDSGQAGEAVFSLRRVVARNPAFAGARLELARAYFDLGDNELARNEFQRLLTEDPPGNVRQAIDNYLIAIDQRAKTYQSSFERYVSLSGGYDSNAVAATDDEQFLSFRLSSNNVEQDSMFGQLELGLNWSKPVTATSQIAISSGVTHRSNPSAHFVDATNLNLNFGWNYRNGPHMAGIGVAGIASYLDGDENKQDAVIYGNYAFNVSQQWQLNGFVSYGSVRFEDVLAIQDVDRLSYGIGLVQTGSAHSFSASLIGGSDDERVTGSVFGNDSYGVQLSNMWGRESGPVFVNVLATTTEYDLPFYGFQRDDDLVSFTLGKTWVRVANKWELTLHVNYSQKESTVSLYEFDRWETGISLRRVFD